MKTQPPISLAQIDFSDPAAPMAPAFGDVYHSRAGALEQARHVFLGANDLPARWAGRREFVILETGFGLGNNFLATWHAWEQDPERCQTLSFISIEKHPLTLKDLKQAHLNSALPELAAQLCQAWPPLTPNLHRLVFAGGRVQLLLCLGDAQAWLRELVAEVDAFYLDGFNPKQNPAMWDKHLLKGIARHAAPGATAASWSVAPQLREGLTAAGFSTSRQRGFANKGGMCVARFTPRHAAQKPVGRQALAPQARHALIIGAGLAGAACAWALAERGILSTVIDAQAGPAMGASGNPGGLYHGTLNPDDGLHARFNRACALETERVLRRLPALPWHQQGLLRIETARYWTQMQALIARLGLPPDYVQALSQTEAEARSGLRLGRPAWFYPGGGALAPAAYIAALLRASGAQQLYGYKVARVSRRADGEQTWSAWSDAGRLLGEAQLLILAGGQQGQALLQDLAPGLPLMMQRGQLSHIAQADGRPSLPVAGLGYAIADQAGGLWCGATNQDGDPRPDLLAEDHLRNLAQYAQLANLDEAAAAKLQVSGGRVGWRLATPDRMPLVGGLPQLDSQGQPILAEQLRFTAREAGLAVCSGFGSRGIGWAAMCAQVLAAQVSGAPIPIEASLLDAIDPARFALRGRRVGKSIGTAHGTQSSV
ncbi:FAD-dependent 5-carboxymethylaminomethyl-2-thiouridine(34) oxidoreductase MnmC [Paucibacter sp. B2R-40]|uniref:FAD-dependent 5-carboxymethylaminomethyl-2-thiouridine(34) oxidoreductase MnmC n=1 Tax=Paucibacter sp. B2R-40 TaxID=2893554 RepID=UPI0021E4523B|nr:FAD-dependent 5-carboxymethylaminomethyl-2-thiouridine(34) oxidoreductase MnmC [Paucibacter sp. B2R-40]MCV2356252.1 FAD-dependent 5-carboxymethylaminomethyl-2-thiouridine(34) oxidoreductase MnmC [Paucibacter sp. B2R-40]